ncbi:MAG: hypothetical protein PHR14_10705 [Oscillospiraceae bacterium]|nr:hypothetical protein [Oscillospiraceae bacterium]
MDKKLREVMEHKEDNYLLPFFWPYEGHKDTIATEIEKIYESGCRAICIESRPFGNYCGDTWWSEVECMLKAAEKRGMKVWFLDDKHFPTGSANGLLQKKYPHLERRYIKEHHIDIMGPQKDMSVLLPECREGERIIAACAWKRSGVGEELCGEPIALEWDKSSDFLYFDLPEGCYRIFIICDTPYGSADNFRWYIDMLSPESVHVLIEAVYEEHYKHFSSYFGNTIVGFFSDEPGFNCEPVGIWGNPEIFYHRTIGQPGMALVWHNSLPEHMREYGIKEILTHLPALWYQAEGKSADIRFAYMDTITKLYSRNFSCQLGDWCRAHNVEYTGHIIEDSNAHSRIGSSAGHYFRALSGQDMAGIDIVLHQVMPYMGGYQNAAHIGGGIADPAFFHYTLANLAASLSRIEPRMNGRAMCEVFGAYGWAEGTPMMKWLMDFLLVRGINHFVPHAFSARAMNDDCPPHFYNDGNNPQYEGFSAVMHYANRVAHLLCGTDRQAPGAVFYYAESEWLSGGEFMVTDVPAKALYDEQMDYDILPLDALKTALCKNGKLYVNGHAHSFFVIPQAACLPEELKQCVQHFEQCGIPVYTVVSEKNPYPNQLGISVTARELVAKIRENRLAHYYGLESSLLRIGHFKRCEQDYFMFFNEEPHTVKCEVNLPTSGEYLSLDFMTGTYFKDNTENGVVPVELQPGESVILVFGENDFGNIPARSEIKSVKTQDFLWNIFTKEAGRDTEYQAYKQNAELENITGANALPDFSGYIKYQSEFECDCKNCTIDLGAVGQTAQLYLNGSDCGIRVSAPYKWDISGAVKPGTNKIEVIVANTLVNRQKDYFSRFMPIPPSGLFGPVTISVYGD